MKTQSKFLSVFLVLVMVLGSFAFAFADEAAATEAPQNGNIVVLYTNDVHCGVDDNIGYAGLAAYKKEMEAAGNYVTLVDAGDAIQGAAIGTLSKGEYLVDIMNKVGYDVAVPGNHEFDYGMDQFLELAKNKANASYICCNFISLATDEPVFDAYVMKTYGDIKVAYVGIDTPETFVKSTPTYFQDKDGKYIYDFCNDATGDKLYKAVQKAVDAAKTAGADYVIAVGHLGIDDQSSPWTSKEVIANTTGIDAFIDGHSHSTIPGEAVANKDGKTISLTSTGTKLAAIGKLVIAANGTITTSLVTDYATKDTAVDEYIKGIQASYNKLLQTVVAKSGVALTTKDAKGERAVRNQETNLGDLCADAYRTVLGADIAFVNGGGVRADIPAGNITYEQIIAVHPFGNMACVVEATGQQILDALEMASRTCPSENGGFLQVSGITYTIDTTLPSKVVVDDKSMFVKVDGDYRVKNVKVGGKDLDLKATYKLASHNYMLKSGGDGINMFMSDKLLQDEVMIDNQVLIKYIEDYLNGTVGNEYAKAQGRITVQKTPYADCTGHWAEDSIAKVVAAGQFNGVSDTSFAPNASMTRAMFVTVLGRMSNVKADEYTTTSFTDVTAGSWYAPYVEWAASKGIVSGVSEGKFDPNASITRAQMATIIANYTDLGAKDVYVLNFTDKDAVASWAQKGVGYCADRGIITGYPDGSFAPAKTATRAEVAAIVSRLADMIAADAAADKAE